MKLKILFLTASLGLLQISVTAQSVAITGNKVTYTRKQPQNEYKKTFVINYPKVRAATPALSRRIESAVSYKSVLDLDLKSELTDTQWIEEADYDVSYNKNGILSMDLSMNGSSAYVSGITRTAVVDLKTGRRVKAADVFTNLPALAAMIRKAQRREIASAIVEIRKNKEANEPNPKSLFTSANFTVRDLERFSVNNKGVTFTYDYGFPHVIQALQPDGTFAYTWRQLKPFIKRGGLFGQFDR